MYYIERVVGLQLSHQPEEQNQTVRVSRYHFQESGYTKGEFQICPRMDFFNIVYVEYLHITTKMKLFYSSKAVRPQGAP